MPERRQGILPGELDLRAALTIVQQVNIDTVAQCFQCRLSSANKRDFRNDTSDAEQARRELDEAVQICSLSGSPVSNVPLYTQFPIPSDPALAMHVDATTTYTKRETPTPTVEAPPPLTFINPAGMSGAQRTAVPVALAGVVAAAVYLA